MLGISSSAIKTDISAAPRLESNAEPSARSLSRAGWQAYVCADTLVLSLHGDWSVRGEGSHTRTPERTGRQNAGAMRAHIGVVERVGDWALARWSDGAAFATLAGEAVLRAAPALRGRVRTRAGDLLNLIYGTSAAAQPMVALVNILVGAIVAFVGAIQLRRLGAEVSLSQSIDTIVQSTGLPASVLIVTSKTVEIDGNRADRQHDIRAARRG
jgi:hypothetical protein